MVSETLLSDTLSMTLLNSSPSNISQITKLGKNSS